MMDKKKILIGLGAIIIIVVLVVFYFVYQGKLIVSSDYYEANYYLNDKEIKTEQKIRLWPKNYKLKFVKEGYEEKVFDIEVDAFKTTTFKVPVVSKTYDKTDEYYGEVTPEQSKLNLIKRLPFSAEWGDLKLENNQVVVTISEGHTKDEALSWFEKINIKDTQFLVWK